MSTPKQDEEKGWLALQQARGYVKAKFPYFYTTLLGLIPKNVPGIGTLFVTPKMVLGIDMVWYGTLPIKQAGGVLIHEVMHILRDLKRIHALPNQRLASYAFDIPINDDLTRFGVELPSWGVWSKSHGFPEGLTGEKYYELLEKKGFDPGEGKVCAGKCGGCSGYEDIEDIPDEPGRTPVDILHFRKEGLQAIKEHIKKGGFGRGNTPGSLRDLLEFDGTEEAVIPWEQINRAAAGRAYGRVTHGHSDYSLRRPAKRSYTSGIIRPGLISYEPSICFIEDWSGSMGAEQLKANRVELANVMKTLGTTEVWFIGGDTVASKPKLVSMDEFMKMEIVGRGGTDFRPQIEAATRIKPAPDIIYYSTDGDGAAPEHQPPNTEFIWLLAPGPWTRSPCNWGTQILTTNDPNERKKYEILN